MFDFQRVFHVGIAVLDLEASKAQFSSDLNLSWTSTWVMDPLAFWTPELGEHEIVVKACYSRPGPHHLELVEANSPFYNPEAQPDSRHVGVWVDDLAGECERLLLSGWSILASGAAPENGFGKLSYLTPATGGLVVELVTSSLKPVIEEWLESPSQSQ